VAKSPQAARNKGPRLAATGARVGELIFLQEKDVYQLSNGWWVADLTTTLAIPDGSNKKRQLKNKSSRRLFALHDSLTQVGFIDYCQSRGTSRWIGSVALPSQREPLNAAMKRTQQRVYERVKRMKKDADDADKTSMRLKDLQLTAELLSEAVAQENGARERVAERRGIQKSVITDRVRRMERFFEVKLFTGPQHKTPTAAGRKMARYGPQLMEEIGHFAEILRNAQEEDEVH
jgi:hypothetical protein